MLKLTVKLPEALVYVKGELTSRGADLRGRVKGCACSGSGCGPPGGYPSHTTCPTSMGVGVFVGVCVLVSIGVPVLVAGAGVLVLVPVGGVPVGVGSHSGPMTVT